MDPNVEAAAGATLEKFYSNVCNVSGEFSGGHRQALCLLTGGKEVCCLPCRRRGRPDPPPPGSASCAGLFSNPPRLALQVTMSPVGRPACSGQDSQGAMKERGEVNSMCFNDVGAWRDVVGVRLGGAWRGVVGMWCGVMG